jgi:hypothetical protein
MIDFFFHYKNIGRFVILNKFSSNLFNSYNFLKFSKVVIFFSLKDIDNIDDLRISNYVFFYLFFFGVQGFFFNFFSTFRLGVTYYDLNIQCVLMKKFIFFVLCFLVNENINFVLLDRLNCPDACWLYRAEDLSILVDRSSVVGLFSIYKPVDFSFFFSSSWHSDVVLFSLFKLS